MRSVAASSYSQSSVCFMSKSIGILPVICVSCTEVSVPPRSLLWPVYRDTWCKYMTPCQVSSH